MSKMVKEILHRPFKAEDIEWRIQQAGEKNGNIWAMCLAYVTNRAIQDRLDEAFGIYGWKNEFVPTPTVKGVMCGISVNINGQWITKYDGADETDIEATKGGISSAMKRAGVQWGIGRYLYHLEAGFARIVDSKTANAKTGRTKEGKYFRWLPPELPEWALPITGNQLEEISSLIDRKDFDPAAFKEYFGYEHIKNATKEDGAKMIRMLSKKPDKQENAA